MGTTGDGSGSVAGSISGSLPGSSTGQSMGGVLSLSWFGMGGSFNGASDSLGPSTCLLGLRAPFMLGRLLGSKLVGAFPSSVIQG